tara:strand:+ start:445 stop:618 length:174 start_codon:yes stop_codon:yes gene_type:complete
MKKQATVHISFPEKEMDLYNSLMRESNFSYAPLAAVCRKHIRRSLKNNLPKNQFVSA